MATIEVLRQRSRARRRRWFRVGSRLTAVAVWVVLLWVAVEILDMPTADDLAASRQRWVEVERRLHTTADEEWRRAAEAEARGLLVERPLESRALRLLALAADGRGERDRAEDMMTLALQRSRADVPAQAWLLERRVEEGDFLSALPHLNAILRVNPGLLEALMPSILTIVGSEGLDAFVDLLATDPPWRGLVLRRFAADSLDPRIPFPVFRVLISREPPLPAPELNPYLHRLVRAGLYDLAYLVWTRWLPRDRLSRLSWLNNGGFETLPSGSPFDWHFDAAKGARIGLASSPGVLGGNALRIQFLDTRVAFRHVKQLLLLVGGTYRLTGMLLTEDLETERGLQWRVTCAGGAGKTIGESGRLIEAPDWTAFSFVIEVPDRGCRAHWLTLELPARVASERQIAGRIWFDGLTVERLSAKAPPGDG